MSLLATYSFMEDMCALPAAGMRPANGPGEGIHYLGEGTSSPGDQKAYIHNIK